MQPEHHKNGKPQQHRMNNPNNTSTIMTMMPQWQWQWANDEGILVEFEYK
jgi:hypothetical protein